MHCSLHFVNYVVVVVVAAAAAVHAFAPSPAAGTDPPEEDTASDIAPAWAPAVADVAASAFAGVDAAALVHGVQHRDGPDEVHGAVHVPPA